MEKPTEKQLEYIKSIKDRMRELEDSGRDKDRTILQLLELMLQNQYYYELGLCAWSNMLRFENIITDNENVALRSYIRKNRPSSFSSWSAFKNRKIGYYWPDGDIKPRIKWINQQIAKLKTQK